MHVEGSTASAATDAEIHLHRFTRKGWSDITILQVLPRLVFCELRVLTEPVPCFVWQYLLGLHAIEKVSVCRPQICSVTTELVYSLCRRVTVQYPYSECVGDSVGSAVGAVGAAVGVSVAQYG